MSSINNKFNEVYKEYDSLVWNILNKYIGNGVLPRDLDDLHQDVWMAVWDNAVKLGDFPENLQWQIAAITRNIVRDFKRKDQRMNQITSQGYQQRVDYYGANDDTDEGGSSGVFDVQDTSQEDRDREQEFQEFLNQYPEGSKERIYIEYYLDKAYGEGGKRYTDSELAQMLGWSGTSSGAWKSFKSRMNQEIADYFGYVPKKKEYASRGRHVESKIK